MSLLYYFSAPADIKLNYYTTTTKAKEISPAFATLLDQAFHQKSIPSSVKFIARELGWEGKGVAAIGCKFTKGGFVADFKCNGEEWALRGDGGEVHNLLQTIQNRLGEVRNTLDYSDVRRTLDWVHGVVKAEQTGLRGLYKTEGNSPKVKWFLGAIAKSLTIEFEIWETKK